MFSSFSSAVLLLHNQTQSICTILNKETWNELDTCWPHDKTQDGREYLHNLFSSRSSGTVEKGGGGQGGHVPPQYFQNYKELVRKSVLCPPNLKVAPQSLIFPHLCKEATR